MLSNYPEQCSIHYVVFGKRLELKHATFEAIWHSIRTLRFTNVGANVQSS